jgi:CIC family chloride channel protein
MKWNKGILPDRFRWAERFRSNQSILIVFLSVAVGLSSGAGVWLFKQFIALFQRLAFTDLAAWLAPLGHWTFVLPTALGGLLVGWIVYRFVGPEKVHGVAGVMEAVALSGGRLPYARVPAKAIASALSIGVGASVGPEDPSVQIGANLGSMIGQRLHLSEDLVRGLVAAGAAGGVSAAFNAPIASVFFALEIVLGELSGSALTMIVLSSVISAVFTQAVAGREPAFHVTAYAFNSVWELPLYLVLGLLAGSVAAIYIRAIYAFRDQSARMQMPSWLKPAVGGLIVGAVGLALPQVLGVGYETITQIFSGATFPIAMLLVLMVVKLVLTPFSLASGFQGGVFAPSLYLGATLGGAFGMLSRMLFPALNINPAAFAMVGMAAVLAGTVHAPLTAILLLFEMTNDYRIILPLMAAVVISLLISEHFQPESVYSLGLLRHGIRLERGRDVEVLEGITVKEVMDPQPVALNTQDTLAQALERFSETHLHGFPVLDPDGELAGVCTLADLEKEQPGDTRSPAKQVGEISTQRLITCTPQETLAAALRRMSIHDIGLLPVVDSANPRRLIGQLRRADVIRAYDMALSRRQIDRHNARVVRLNTLSRLPVEEVAVEAGSPCAGKSIAEIHWPPEVVVVSIHRGRDILIPHGATRISPKDRIVFLSESQDSAAQTRELCRAKTPR